MDIIIYTTKDKVTHKMASKSNRLAVAYWTLANFPKKIEYNNKELIYFAWEGMIQGYFLIEDVPFFVGKEIPENAVKFRPYWHELKTKIPTKSFQGFKYADKVPELKNILTEVKEE